MNVTRQFSRHALYAAGEPFGSSATQALAGGRRRYGGGGGSGGGTTTSYNTTSNVPDFAKQPFMDMIGQAQALSQTPYQPYTGDRQAQFTPLQQQAMDSAANLGPTQQTQAAGGLAAMAAQKGFNAGNYQAGQFGLATGPQQVQSSAAVGGVAGPGGYEKVGTKSFLDGNNASAYMNPYMQQVVDIQKREATRQDAMQGQARNAQAVAAGAYGGSRQAIVDAEAQRNLNQHLDDIQAQGSNAAYQQALGQFNTEQQMGLQAQTANQRAGLDTSQMAMQAQIANQNAGLAAAQQALQAQMANQNAGLQFNNQFLDMQRANEQSRQFGSQMGLQGAQLGLQSANTLGQLGNDYFGQQLQGLNTQNAFGTQQQQQVQNILNQQYGDFQQQRDYPYQQIGFLSDLLRGSGSSTRTMYPSTSPLQTVAGIGTTLAGLGKTGGFRKGGKVKAGLADIAPEDMDFADGGIVGYASGGSTEDDDEGGPGIGGMAGAAVGQAAGVRAVSKARAAAAAAARAQLKAQVTGGIAPELTGVQRALLNSGKLGGIASKAGGAGLVGLLGSASVTPYTQSIGTPTDYYARQLGLNPGEVDTAGGIAKNTLIRTLGTGADIVDNATFGGLGALTGYKQYKAPPAAPAETVAAAPAKGDDTVTTPPVDLAASGSAKASGIAGLAGASAGPAPTIAGVRKMYADGSTLDADTKAIQDANAQLEQAQRQKAEGELADYDKLVAAAGPAGAEREQAIKAQQDELGSRKDHAQGQALMQAGLAILSADPSRGAWAAIGQGLGVGLKQYRGDVAELEQRKAQLDDQLAQIGDMRRAELMAQGKERMALKSQISAATVEAKKNASALLTSLLPLKAQQSGHIVDSFIRTYDSWLQRDTQLKAAGIMANARVGAAEVRSSLGGMKPGSPDYVDELRKRVADLSKDPQLMLQLSAKEKDPLKQRTLLENYARQSLDQDIATYGRAAQLRGAGAATLPPGTQMTVTP